MTSFCGRWKLVRDLDGIAMVHAENGLAIDHLEKTFTAQSKTTVEWFERSRPKRLEYEAVFRAIQLAAVAECPLYLVHQTTAEGAQMVAAARAEGQFVIGETCPQYLFWTNDDLVAYGPVGVLAPPYRTVENQEHLWKAIASGEISVVGSDHAPHDKREQKNVFSVPVGTPQVETMLGLLFDRGVDPSDPPSRVSSPPCPRTRRERSVCFRRRDPSRWAPTLTS